MKTSLIIICLVACLSFSNASFLPQAWTCGEVKELQCVLDVKGAVKSCATAAAASGLNPIADYKCIKNVLGVEHQCVSCICQIAKNNNWDFLADVCKQQGYEFEPLALPEGCGLELEEKCAIDLETALKQCEVAVAEKVNPIADYKCVVDTIKAVKDCESCICKAAENNNWEFIEKECQVVEPENQIVLFQQHVDFPEGCGLELEEKCAIDLEEAFKQCEVAVAEQINPIADYKCVKDLIRGAQDCEACICKAAENNNWTFIEKECAKVEPQVLPMIPEVDTIHGCGIELEEICGIDLYATFEACAKAYSEGFVNIFADFKCVKDVINAEEQCDACICKAAELNDWHWIEENACPKN